MALVEDDHSNIHAAKSTLAAKLEYHHENCILLPVADFPALQSVASQAAAGVKPFLIVSDRMLCFLVVLGKVRRCHSSPSQSAVVDRPVEHIPLGAATVSDTDARPRTVEVEPSAQKPVLAVSNEKRRVFANYSPVVNCKVVSPKPGVNHMDLDVHNQ